MSLFNSIPRPLMSLALPSVTALGRVLFAGDRYHDPLSGRSYRTFLPHGPDRLRSAGWSPDVIDYAARFPPDYVERMRLALGQPLVVAHPKSEGRSGLRVW